MKKNIGVQPALYPMPAAVIGVMNADKPAWTLAANTGNIGCDRILADPAASYFTNGIIRKIKYFPSILWMRTFCLRQMIRVLSEGQKQIKVICSDMRLERRGFTSLRLLSIYEITYAEVKRLLGV